VTAPVQDKGREAPPRVYIYREWVCAGCSQTWPWRPRSKRPRCLKCNPKRSKLSEVR
jgi:hypothetical protein